jgi:hypothetical protein
MVVPLPLCSRIRCLLTPPWEQRQQRQQQQQQQQQQLVTVGQVTQARQGSAASVTCRAVGQIPALAQVQLLLCHRLGLVPLLCHMLGQVQ